MYILSYNSAGQPGRRLRLWLWLTLLLGVPVLWYVFLGLWGPSWDPKTPPEVEQRSRWAGIAVMTYCTVRAASDGVTENEWSSTTALILMNPIVQHLRPYPWLEQGGIAVRKDIGFWRRWRQHRDADIGVVGTYVMHGRQHWVMAFPDSTAKVVNAPPGFDPNDFWQFGALRVWDGAGTKATTRDAK